MKDPADRDELLQDVLAETASGPFRATLLNEGLSGVRRKRRRRRITRAVAMMSLPLLLIAGAFLMQKPRLAEPAVRPSAHPPLRAREVVPGTQMGIISDAELLDLFKNRPVALIGPRGRQRIVLLDEVQN